MYLCIFVQYTQILCTCIFCSGPDNYVYLCILSCSGPNDHVFVYFSDHGAPGIVAFPSDEVGVHV